MMFIKNYCMTFMILLVMLCITLYSSTLSLIISDFFFCFLDITHFVGIIE